MDTNRSKTSESLLSSLIHSQSSLNRFILNFILKLILREWLYVHAGWSQCRSVRQKLHTTHRATFGEQLALPHDTSRALHCLTHRRANCLRAFLGGADRWWWSGESIRRRRQSFVVYETARDVKFGRTRLG